VVSKDHTHEVSDGNMDSLETGLKPLVLHSVKELVNILCPETFWEFEFKLNLSCFSQVYDTAMETGTSTIVINNGG
jgi:hypothetical protein